MFKCDHEWKPSYVMTLYTPDGEEVRTATNSYCTKCLKIAPKPWKEVPLSFQRASSTISA